MYHASKKISISFIHVQWLRCQEFCHASVPLTLSLWNILSLSLWLNITPRPRAYSERKGWEKNGGKGREEEAPQLPFILSSCSLLLVCSCSLLPKRVQEESWTIKTEWGWKWSGREMEKKRGLGGGKGLVCRAERCAVHHLQTGRQGCLGSLFLPPYKSNLDGLR